MLTRFLLAWSGLALVMHLVFAIGWLPGNAYLAVFPVLVGLFGHVTTLTITGRWNQPKVAWTDLRRAWGPAATWCTLLYLYAGFLVTVAVVVGIKAGDRLMTPGDLQQAGSIFCVLSAAWSIGNWGVCRLPRPTSW